MPHFTPPTVRRAAEWAANHPLIGRIKIPVGITVLKSPSGGYTAVENPSTQDIDAAAITYLGGHTYTVSDAEAADLTAAGYEVAP